jgi:hypothetical protein
MTLEIHHSDISAHLRSARPFYFLLTCVYCFAGEPEKGHYQVLQELVNADEKHQAYDSIPLESKLLIEDIQERQMLVSQGLLDLKDGFDDFRIGLGD